MCITAWKKVGKPYKDNWFEFCMLVYIVMDFVHLTWSMESIAESGIQVSYTSAAF